MFYRVSTLNLVVPTQTMSQTRKHEETHRCKFAMKPKGQPAERTQLR